jgi:hypothetical protein
MKTILLNTDKYDILMGQLCVRLLMEGISTEKKGECLCNSNKLEGFDNVIFHPEYDNTEGCWSRIKDILENNPSVQFYMLAINASERLTFFGKIPNLHYITGGSFFEDPVKYILEHNSKK